MVAFGVELDGGGHGARCAARGWACGSCEWDRSFGLASGRGASDRVCGGVGFVSDGGCYLDELAQEGARRGVLTVVYLDNASFHRSQDFRRC